jgi:ankyrin repeat protein
MAEAAFMKAARRGLKEPLELLLKTGKAQVNYFDEEGCSALMYAAMGGFAEVVQLLRDFDSDLNHADNNGQTAMMHAAFHGHAEVVKVLARSWEEYEEIPFSDGQMNTIHHQGASLEGALCSAAKGGQLQVLKLLVELKSDVNVGYKGEYPLMLAVEGNHLETVRFLVTECDCYDVPREGQSMEAATSAGHADIVILLLNWEPAKPAAESRMEEVV